MSSKSDKMPETARTRSSASSLSRPQGSSKPILSPKKAPGSAVKVRRLAGNNALDSPLFSRVDTSKGKGKAKTELGWIDLDRTALEKRVDTTPTRRRLRARKPTAKASLADLMDSSDSEGSGGRQKDLDSEFEESDASGGDEDDFSVLVPKSLKLREGMNADTALRMTFKETWRPVEQVQERIQIDLGDDDDDDDDDLDDDDIVESMEDDEEDAIGNITHTMDATTLEEDEEHADEDEETVMATDSPFHDSDVSQFDFDDDISLPPSTPPRKIRKTAGESSLSFSTPISSTLTKTPSTSLSRQDNLLWNKDFVDDWNDDEPPRKSPEVSPTKGREVPPAKRPAPNSSAAREARKSFAANKDALAKSFLLELDNKITEGRLSQMTHNTGGVAINWNNKLNTTAGRANWSRKTHTTRREGQQDLVEHRNYASIDLADKVIDNEDRLLNVVAHEFCHLANFMINNITANPHGREFKAWASQVTKAFSHRGIVVTTLHSYDIDFKYVWECSECATEYKRHSKSINPERQRCGKCKAALIQTRPKPRAAGSKPSDYQMFMSEQMKRIKTENPGMRQSDIMKMVADMWANHGKSTSLAAKAAAAATKAAAIAAATAAAAPIATATKAPTNSTSKVVAADTTKKPLATKSSQAQGPNRSGVRSKRGKKTAAQTKQKDDEEENNEDLLAAQLGVLKL